MVRVRCVCVRVCTAQRARYGQINILNRNRAAANEHTITTGQPAPNAHETNRKRKHSDRNGWKKIIQNSFIMKLWQIARAENNSDRPNQDLLHPTATHFTLIFRTRYVQAKLIRRLRNMYVLGVCLGHRTADNYLLSERPCASFRCGLVCRFLSIQYIQMPTNGMPPRIQTIIIFFSPMCVLCVFYSVFLFFLCSVENRCKNGVHRV